jgi:hypothetical protein
MNGRLRAGLDTGCSRYFRGAIRRVHQPLGCSHARLCGSPLPVASMSVHAAATAIVLALALAGCQTPATKTVVQEVRVPVAVQPIKPADVPALPAPLPKRPADARQALDVALAQVCRWVAFGLRAEPLLRVSAGLPPQEAPAYPECSKR